MNNKRITPFLLNVNENEILDLIIVFPRRGTKDPLGNVSQNYVHETMGGHGK